ncbi:MAG TPA: tetratricopeptide repeat-containing glycosyltransferase family protein [Stellaceae bacterium]|nr:tetratricopeptide repeat-containing glycosyltransferase family protein [Stellaceae bacterium]
MKQAISRAAAVPEILRQGTAHHQAGRLPEAEACYRQILAIDPHHADGLHLLGVIALQVGRCEQAVELIGHAIKRQPRLAHYHSNLGNAFAALGRYEEAATSCREARRLNPNFPTAHNNLANVLQSLGRLDEAEASCRAALTLNPAYPEAHNSLGYILHEAGRNAEAEMSCREALRLRPGFVEAHNNLGNALRDLGHAAEAEASYATALALRPDYVEAHYNRGNAFAALGQLDAAERASREALRLRPDYVRCHIALGMHLLLAGRLDEGWPEYEWRWRSSSDGFTGPRDFAQPRWKGERLEGRVLLLHAEQGFGDTLQFCRYASLAATRAGGRIVLEVPRPLARLTATLPGVDQVVVEGDALPPFDLHCPLLSLPDIFGTTLDTIPALSPYLAADPAQTARWRARLETLPGLRVGLVWAGNPRRSQPSATAIDRRRSLTLSHLAPLGGIDGISFVSLQKGDGASQRIDLPTGMSLHDWTHELHDFADTAALIEGLDLVIGVDTAVIHLAGALGKPIWLLNRFDTCWRWLLGRDDSPWYPSLRQFRQPRMGDWTSVLADVRIALDRVANEGRR